MLKTPSRFVRRLPLLALALVALLAGLWAGLERLGFDLPQLRPALASEHGPLMVLGFLGTQISLERAVALHRSWPYIAPTGAGAGALWLLVGLPATVGEVLLAIAGAALLAIFIVVHKIQPSWHNAIMGLGAVGWLIASIVWLTGDTMPEVVPWLAAFLVLTIVGERLELSRMRRPPLRALVLLVAAVALFSIGVALTSGPVDVGVRIAGAGLLAQAAWLARYDVTRRTIRVPGATRYMAIALMTGYVWLAIAGGVWMAEGALAGGGFAYDAMIHAIFLGFVFSMIFAHAPVIVPAVLAVPLPYKPSFYVPLALLHAGLVIRLAGGDAAGNLVAWRTGGVINEVAILLFLALAAHTVMKAKGAKAKRGLSAPASIDKLTRTADRAAL